MQKIKSIINTEVKGRQYELFCDTDSPIDDAIEANVQINAFLIGRKEQVRLAQEAEKSAEIEQEPEVTAE